MLRLAHTVADRMAAPSSSEQQRTDLRDAVVATQELAEHGSAVGTLEMDDRAWLFWERFCALYGWDDIFDASFARANPQEISQRLAVFQSWVYPQLRGRGGRQDAKPRTVFNDYVLAILRIFNRAHIPMPKAKHVEKNLAGLLRSFKNIYGVEVLMPGRKQPLTPAMWARIEALPEQSSLSGRAPWSPRSRHRDRTMLRLGRVLWRTGHRLGEIVAHPSGEINFLTRSSLSIRKNSGLLIASPTSADWRALSSGDVVLLAPCASKSDQFGEVHCPYPSVLPFNGDNDCAAAAVRDIELEQPCLPDARKTTPLFADANGQAFSYAILHNELRALLTGLFGHALASTHSWHSIRIGLACALHAANCPDAVIQLICRWQSPESLRVYRQTGIEKNIYWTELAGRTTFDAVRVNNLPALDNDDARVANPLQLTPRRTVGAAPAQSRTPIVAPAERVLAYSIPGGTVQGTDRDANALVGKRVGIYNNFWRGYDNDFQRTECLVAARCCREFRHPDGTRVLTYLLEYGDLHYPIKHAHLLACMSPAERAQLPRQSV